MQRQKNGLGQDIVIIEFSGHLIDLHIHVSTGTSSRKYYPLR